MEEQHSIEALVQEARKGDASALSRLTTIYRQRLMGLVTARLGEPMRSTVEPEDIVQESFLRAHKAIHDFSWQGEESFFRWLGGIANHVLLEQAKRHKLRRADSLEFEVPAASLSQSKAQRREERFDRLEDALKALSPEHRRVILLARVERLPVKEVAQRMNRTRGAVRQLLWRALQELKTAFGETDSLHLPPRHFDLEGESGGER